MIYYCRYIISITEKGVAVMSHDPYFQGKVAWVTGSSRGIGRAIAEHLAAAGCNVVISGRASCNLRSSGEGESVEAVAAAIAEKYNVKAIAVCGQLTDEDAVAESVKTIQAQLGEIDYLICNAGGANVAPDGALQRNNPIISSFEFELKDVQTIMDHNLLPALLCCRAVVPQMVARKTGKIITIGSIAACGAEKNPGDAYSFYSLAKNGIHQYTRLLAAKLRHDGIPVNCIVPGNINTPSTRIRFGGDRENPIAGLSRLEHVGTVDDIGRLACFLCGPGGEYISGQVIRVDGGEQLWPC